MKIEVAPYSISPFCNLSGNRFEGGEKRAEENKDEVSCWGVYVDGKCVFFTSSRESAEKTKVWMEKHLKEEAQSLGQKKR
ncbi:MAG TPA: hypothetical protein VLB01_03740 [Thermodesulfobacteriota bacterium]|nr:hypothetical protein [Thermodesulfobacteriota bacterium]